MKSEFSQGLTHLELRKGADDSKEWGCLGGESGGRERTLVWHYHFGFGAPESRESRAADIIHTLTRAVALATVKR